MTVISGLARKGTNVRGIAKSLKRSLASGGTAKGSDVLLQGDHWERVKRELVEMGFRPDMIDV